MKPPAVLAQVVRGGRPESLHRGDIAVVDEAGTLLAYAGNPLRSVYLRSAAKPFQVIPLLAAGGERAFALGNDEIALMCASHGGEPRHVRVARRLLDRGGFTVHDLKCGAQLPSHPPSAQALLRRGQRPSVLHNNCSGKHAGILLACRLSGFQPRGYCDPAHPIQRLILARVAKFCGVAPDRIGLAMDGCSLPVFFLPLTGLALGYARLMARSVSAESAEERAIRHRIREAMCGSPGMVAGQGRFTTRLLEAGKGRWIGKEGAEGVYAVGLTAARRGGRAVGIAFKVEDGSTRARDAVTLAILDRMKRLPPDVSRRLAEDRVPVLRNVTGKVVGRVEARPPLAWRGRRAARKT